MQFGDDWPGLFIRGDLALDILISLQAVFDGTAKVQQQAVVDELVKNLQSCDARTTPKVQPMKSYRACLTPQGLRETRPDKDWSRCSQEMHADDCDCNDAGGGR
jgi:hypothetical protein